MLVIERVPLQLLEQIARVHHLEAQMPVSAEQRAGSFEDLLGIVVVGEGVAAGHDVHAPEPFDQLRGRRSVEVSRHDVEPLVARHLSDVVRHVHADRLDAQLPQRLEQDAIVAPELRHLAGRKRSTSHAAYLRK